MFKRAVIHYPTDEDALAQIGKELVAFRCEAAIKYINSLQLNDSQIDTLYVALAKEIGKRHIGSA